MIFLCVSQLFWVGFYTHFILLKQPTSFYIIFLYFYIIYFILAQHRRIADLFQTRTEIFFPSLAPNFSAFHIFSNRGVYVRPSRSGYYLLYILQKDWARDLSTPPAPPNKTSSSCRPRRAPVYCFTHLCAKGGKRSGRIALPTHVGRGNRLTPWSTERVWEDSVNESSEPATSVCLLSSWLAQLFWCQEKVMSHWEGIWDKSDVKSAHGVCLSLTIESQHQASGWHSVDIPRRPHTHYPLGLSYFRVKWSGIMWMPWVSPLRNLWLLSMLLNILWPSLSLQVCFDCWLVGQTAKLSEWCLAKTWGLCSSDSRHIISSTEIEESSFSESLHP